MPLTKPASKKPKSKLIMALGLVIIFLVVYFPNIEMSILTASNPRFVPSDAWVSSLLWMKDNTPEPLGGPDAYYQLEERHKWPESAYGVLAWWDYGYWISRIARRLPNTNPSQEYEPTTSVAKFFTSQDENSANRIVEELGSAYIIIDYAMAVRKLGAILIWAGEEQSDYSEVYYLPQGGYLVPVRYYYPDYYRSLSTRLYNFNGEAVIPDSVTVIIYEEQSGRKVIMGERQVDSYEEAEAYIFSREPGNHRIASKDPFISPIPLVAVESYRLIHSSNETVEYCEMSAVPEVKIFEYLPFFN